MDKKRGLLTFLLFVLSVAFIAFVIIMQHNFSNPDFATAQSNSEEAVKDKSENNSDTKDEKETEKDTETVKYVIADLLNVRSEPNTDSTIVYTLRLNDEVTVESIEESDEWVQVTTEDFTGYVKDKYLEEK